MYIYGPFKTLFSGSCKNGGNIELIAMKMAGLKIWSITLSDDSDKLNLEPTNNRLNNDIFNFEIHVVQPSS